MTKFKFKMLFKKLQKKYPDIKIHLKIICSAALRGKADYLPTRLAGMEKKDALIVINELKSVYMPGKHKDVHMLEKLTPDFLGSDYFDRKYDKDFAKDLSNLCLEMIKLNENEVVGYVLPWIQFYIQLNKNNLLCDEVFEELSKIIKRYPHLNIKIEELIYTKMVIDSSKDIDNILDFIERQKNSNLNLKFDVKFYNKLLTSLKQQGKMGFAYYLWDKLTNNSELKKFFLTSNKIIEIFGASADYSVKAAEKLFANPNIDPYKNAKDYQDFFKLILGELTEEHLNKFIPEITKISLGANAPIASIISFVYPYEYKMFVEFENKIMYEDGQPLTEQERYEKVKKIIHEYKTYGLIIDCVWEGVYKQVQGYAKNLSFEEFKAKASKCENIKHLLEEKTKEAASKFYSAESFKQAPFYVDTFKKFGKLFQKTRFQDFPDWYILEYLSETQAENFDLKTFKQFMDLPACSWDFEQKRAFIYFADVFGLFESDSGVQERRKIAYKLLSQDKDLFHYKDLDVVADHFEEVILKGYTVSTEHMSEELKAFLTSYINQQEVSLADYRFNEAEFKELKSMSGDLGKKINNFLSPYKKTEKGYELKRGVQIPASLKESLKPTLTEQEYKTLFADGPQSVKNFLRPFVDAGFKKYKPLSDIPKSIMDYCQFEKQSYNFYDSPYEGITANVMHEMFDGLEAGFDEDFYKFLVKHWDYAIRNGRRQKLKDVQRAYKKAVTYFTERGNSTPSYHDILCYINKSPFVFKYGRQEFAQEAKNAGVGLQETYSFYEEMLPSLESRKLSTIPRHNKTYVYEANGKQYKVCAKILRLDDQTTMLVGESKFTNCCQRYRDAGQACMEHSATSQNGGILATYLIAEDGTMQMLTQSWIWTNEQTLCLDNIEATNLVKSAKEKELYQDIAFFAIVKASEEILEQSKQKVEEYYSKQLQLAKTLSTEDYEKRKSELDEFKQRQTLRVVTAGTGYDDVGMSRKFLKQEQNPLGPKDYTGYRDSYTQYILASSKTDALISSSSYKEVPLYRDDRQVVKMQGKRISQKMLKHITDIETIAHKKHMRLYTNGDENVLNEPVNLAYLYSCSVDNIKIIAGEDWYIVYGDNGREIEVYDFAKSQPRLADENQAQQKEMMNAFNEILKDSVVYAGKATRVKTIKADLREDTSYLLYLFQLKHGLIEQIGDDLKYDYEQDDKKTPVTASEQLQTLKNAKQIREESAENKTTMHQVAFVPSQKTVDKIIKNIQDENKEIV